MAARLYTLCRSGAVATESLLGEVAAVVDQIEEVVALALPEGRAHSLVAGVVHIALGMREHPVTWAIVFDRAQVDVCTVFQSGQLLQRKKGN